MPALSLTVLGGAAGTDEASGEIGGNRILLEFGSRRWLLDFGTRFGRLGRYSHELLSPRGAAGLTDYLRLNLVPPLEGVLRDDLSRHDPGLWERFRSHPHYRKLSHLDGVLLSHAHQDHNGCLGFLKQEIPVYASLMTALIGKASQDLGGGGPESQFSYLAPCEFSETGALRGIPGVRTGRPHYLCESDEPTVDALEDLRSFFSDHPGRHTVFEPALIQIADLAALGLRFFRVDHSIPGSGAFAIHTPIGWVGYTGDLRLHGHSRWRTERFARELAGLAPELLIVEGTSLSDRKAQEENEVHQAALEVVRRESGLVIADFSPRNIERLRTFRDIAKALGRSLVITSRDAYLLAQMHLIDPAIPRPDQEPLAILRSRRATHQSWEDRVLEESRRSLVDAAAVRRAPGSYLLCLSYWDITNLVDLDPEGGTYLYSASEAHTEEQRIDQTRLRNWLDDFGLRPVGGLPGNAAGPFHASGHIDGPGMEWLIETIDPAAILPVHTQNLGWFESRWPDRVIRAALGSPIVFD